MSDLGSGRMVGYSSINGLWKDAPSSRNYSLGGCPLSCVTDSEGSENPTWGRLCRWLDLFSWSPGSDEQN